MTEAVVITNPLLQFC